MTFLNIVCLLIFIANIIIGIMMLSLKGYATKKGENIATRQDLEYLTTKVQGIEKEFKLQFEQGKIKYDLLSQSLSLVVSKKDELIFSYLEVTSSIYTMMLRPPILIISNSELTNIDLWNNYIRQIENSTDMLTITLSKLAMFFEQDSSLCKTAYSLASIIYDSAIQLAKVDSVLQASIAELYKTHQLETEVATASKVKITQKIYEEVEAYIENVHKESNSFSTAKEAYIIEMRRYCSTLFRQSGMDS